MVSSIHLHFSILDVPPFYVFFNHTAPQSIPLTFDIDLRLDLRERDGGATPTIFAKTKHGLLRLGVVVGPTHFVLLAGPGVNVFAASTAIGARVDVATLARVLLLCFCRHATSC